MSGSGFLILLLSTMSCCAAPKLEKDHCQKPQSIHGVQLQGEWNDKTYPPGTVAKYACLPEYTQDGPIKMACVEGTWWYIAKGQCKDTCQALEHPNGKLQPDKNEYEVGDYLRYECSDGFMTESRNLAGKAQCLGGWWSETPRCIPITCVHEGVLYKDGDVIKYKCPHGRRPLYETGQCYFYGVSPPPFCVDILCTIPETSALILSPHLSSYKFGNKISFACEEGFDRVGSRESTCTDEGWTPSLPTCQISSCKPPPPVTNARINGHVKASYASGEKVTYLCNPGYTLERSGTGEVRCEKTHWTERPVCRKIGEPCGPPPVIQFGDTISFPRASYKSGDFVVYRCPEYYVLKGNKIVKCLHGVWNEAPVCLEPCTVKPQDMDRNNIQLRYRYTQKLYSEHGDNITFACKYEYEAPPDTEMRIVCDHGKLEYPKCLKRGFCVLQQQTMITNNIHYNTSTVLDHGQIILFQCNEEMTPETKLEAKCEWSNINYPKCSASQSCKIPEILNGFIRSEQQASYDSGSYVEFQCKEDYVLDGPKSVKCENGQWMDLPVCHSPCKLSTEELNKYNIQLLPSDDPKTILDINHKHGTVFSVICKSGFRRPNQAALVTKCYDGKFRSPKCFTGKTCRVDQHKLDEKFLELDEVLNDDVFYEEGDIIHFRCKNGFGHPGEHTGTCSEQILSYPECVGESV